MQGTITGKHVVLHPFTIVRVWGLAAWLCCLWAAITRRPTTFLGVLYPANRRLGAQAAGSARRPGAIVLAESVATSRSPELVLAGTSCSRWRSP